MPDLDAFLAAAEAESKTPSVSVGLASGMIPPQLRELMRCAEESCGVTETRAASADTTRPLRSTSEAEG